MKKLWSLIAIAIVVTINSHAFARPFEAALFDKFGDICCDDEKARLDNFAIQLQQVPDAEGYIIFYGGRRHNYPYCDSSRQRLPRRGEAAARVARLKPYLVASRGLDPKRIVIVNGGYRESWEVELWIVPKGTNPPTPTPTVNPQEIKFRRGRIKKRDYECQV